MKTCTGCRLQKPVNDFGVNRHANDGLAYRCKVCTRAFSVESYRRNIDRKLVTCRNYYLSHRETRIAAVAAYHAARPEQVKATQAKYREMHREKLRALDAQRWKKNPDKILAKNATRRAKIAGNGGQHTSADIAWLLKKQRCRCAHTWCRAPLNSKFERDHIIPIAGGGSSDRRNIQLLCSKCNRRKSSKHPIVFAQQHGMLL